jgi:peptide deformylase
MTARMIQHEYDHTERILYLDYLKPLTKKLIEGKLKKIMKGQIQTSYPMKFGNLKWKNGSQVLSLSLIDK